MKRIHFVLISIVLGILVSSCGAIPTLPSLDSTVTIKTPQFTIAPEASAGSGQVDHQGLIETPAENASELPDTVSIQAQPTSTQIQPPETGEIGASATPSVPAASEATATLEPASTTVSYPYQAQILNPHYLPNFSHPDLGCDWLGIGGQIFNREGVVQKDIIIKVGGEIAGSSPLEEMTMPMAEPEIDIAYGPGGYELTLADSPAASDSTLWIQLFSLQGNPLSAKIYLITHDDCQKNLLLMNFVEE